MKRTQTVRLGRTSQDITHKAVFGDDVLTVLAQSPDGTIQEVTLYYSEVWALTHAWEAWCKFNAAIGHEEG